MTPWLQKELAPYLAPLPAGSAAGGVAGRGAAPRSARTIDFLVGLNQRLQQRDRLRHPHGAGRPDLRGDAGAAAAARAATSAWLLVQILRHLGLAARFVSGYLIQLKPDVQAAGRPVRRRPGLHRPARLDRGLPAGRRLGRARSDLRAAGRRRPHSAGLHARSGAARRRSPAASTPCEVEFDFAMTRRRASARRRASPSPTPTSSGSAILAAGRAGRRATEGRRRAPDHGRRADLRLDRRHGRRRVEHDARRARPSGSWPAS